MRYNYNFVWEDGSFGIHNSSYAVQLLQRSYEGVFGHPIDEDYPEMALRGPVREGQELPLDNEDADARIEIVSVTPRAIAASEDDVFDEVASGLDNVGLGQKVYLEAQPVPEADISGYEWTLIGEPGSAATLEVVGENGGMALFRPDRQGQYAVILTPLNGALEPTTPTARLVYASVWVGSGLLNEPAVPARAPRCGTGFCHGGNNANERLNVAPDWVQSAHAHKLQAHMSGERGSHYSVSCLPCHTVGFDEDPAAVNGGFDDVATELDYDLAEIAHLVEQAAETGEPKFAELPGPLQNMASIQCESCHGPGRQHPVYVTGGVHEDEEEEEEHDDAHRIAGANLDPRNCAQCHDSASGYQQGYYQWSGSAHPHAHEISGGRVARSGSCLKCHTGEGFVAVRARGEEAQAVAEPHGITCATCHDPHYSEHAHQLRVAGAFTLDSGDSINDVSAGLGGLCMRCHNARVSDAEDRALTSYRGVHHGPQADMWLGVNGIDFGVPFTENSFHSTGFLGLPGVPDACVFCHMAPPSQSGSGVTEPPRVGSHTYAMRDEMGTPDDPSDDELNAEHTCGQCHANLDRYDRRSWADYDGDGAVEGIQTEVRGLFNMLRPGILANMPGTSVSSTGKIEISGANFANLTEKQKFALYNYNFVWEDGSFGIHNTSYAVQLLQRAYLGVYGRSIEQDYPRVVLRGPVPEPPEPRTGVSNVWVLY